MSDVKILTIAALSAVMVGLAAKAKGTELESDLTGFNEALLAFGSQQDSLNLQGKLEEQILLIKDLQDKLDKTPKDVTEDLENAKAVIKDLKEKLETALQTKKSAQTKPTFELDGEKYVVNSGAHGHGSAAQIAGDEAKQRAILKIDGQQIISKL